MQRNTISHIRPHLLRATSARIHPHTMRAASGFTLMELLLVLSVLIALMAVTLPGVLRWHRHFPLEQATSLLQQQLQETRLGAIQTGQPWRLVLPTSTSGGYRERLASATRVSGSSLSSGRMKELDISQSSMISSVRFQWPTGIQCELLSANPADHGVIFQPDGTAADRDLRLSNPFGSSNVIRIIRLTGQAKIVPAEPRQRTSASLSTIGKALAADVCIVQRVGKSTASALSLTYNIQAIDLKHSQ